LAVNSLLKGGVIVALFYWSWFSFAPHSKEQNILLITLISAPAIVFVARMLALNIPFRLRPMHKDAIDFTLPAGTSEKALEGWSSFPSDHAVLYFAIAVGIFAASRRIGQVAIFYTVVVIGLPRIYVGYHYPSDILAGFIIGGILIKLSLHFFANGMFISRINSWSVEHTGAFYALFFLVGFQLANMFDQSRQIATILFHAVLG
jgi:undecaprenyl-diphosphatase